MIKDNAPDRIRFTPGDIILSRDGRSRYRVQADGSWLRISDQEPQEFETVAAAGGVLVVDKNKGSPGPSYTTSRVGGGAK